jgi:cell wall-associated NlpC family hydrolase
VLAVIALVPVVATAGTVVPSIAAATLAAGGSEVTGNGAELAAHLPGADSDDSPNIGASSANSAADQAGSCPAAPAGAQAVASDACAVSEPPADAGAATAADASQGAGAVARPVSSVSGGTVFDAGNIISDAVFYNSSSMTDEQIQAFLAAQGASCTGAFCVKNLRVDVAAQPADEFCAAVPGGAGLTAAAVIGMVSRACGVNPQVMLVTLEKESGLLDRSGPSASSYDAAWGWHCPDSGPGGTANCDPAYAGFVNQAYGMAKQWSRYKVHPEQYRYRAGETVEILWNVVESGCGGAPVTIANTATASLYNYTPYQPNPAALAAYPGVGDACSAYGNRNFFFLFNRYFASTGGGNTGINVTAAVTGLATPVSVPVPANGFVSGGLAGRSIMAPTPAVAAGLRAGFAALGLPYVWGGGGSGAGPNNGCARGGGQFNSCGTEIGFDCSGLTAYVLGQAGFGIPGDSSGQRRAGIPVSWDRALPGDVVGYPGHVAVYLGITDGVRYILEASWVGTPVHIVPLTRTDADATVYRYWTGIPGVVGASASTLNPNVAAAGPRSYVPNLAPLPVPAGIPGTSSTPPAAPTPSDPAGPGSASSGSGSGSGSPSSGSPSPTASSSSGSPSATSASSQVSTTTGSSVAGSSGPATTETATTATTATATTATGTSATGTTTSGTATTGPATTTTAGGSTATSRATTPTLTSTGQSTATSSQPVTSAPGSTAPGTTASSATTTSPTTSALPTATSTTSAPPATPVMCPPSTPEATAPLTPTLPPPTVGSPGTTAGTAKPAASTATTTFAALIESLLDDPCG